MHRENGAVTKFRNNEITDSYSCGRKREEKGGRPQKMAEEGGEGCPVLLASTTKHETASWLCQRSVKSVSSHDGEKQRFSNVARVANKAIVQSFARIC